ncbi:hypothetical protein [Pseudomonas sp.]|uniref:hypothetical protein n=1 Tax=Pseudomonas sp. TaxID=306 RepID=UPI0025910225|nr:hypothetical protein [Pseudomonas sp.]
MGLLSGLTKAIKKVTKTVTDDVLGLDPGGGGIYDAGRKVLGKTVADDILGMDPNGKGFVKAYNAAAPLVAGYFAAPYISSALGGSATGAAYTGSGLTAGGSGLGLTSGGGLGLTAPTAAAASSPSWLSGLGSAATSYLSNPSNLTQLASVAGGLLGSSKGATSSGASQQYRMDSRLDPLVYGTAQSAGLLGEANALYKMQLASGGMNDAQRQGLELQRQYLTSPRYTQGYDSMMNMGQSLLGSRIAGNPFANGSRTL